MVSYAALFSVVVLREDRHKKWAAWQTRQEKEIHNDLVPSPPPPPQISLPLIAFGNVYWSANLLNLLTNQAQNDLHIIKQTRPSPFKYGYFFTRLNEPITLVWN